MGTNTHTHNWKQTHYIHPKLEARFQKNPHTGKYPQTPVNDQSNPNPPEN